MCRNSCYLVDSRERARVNTKLFAMKHGQYRKRNDLSPTLPLNSWVHAHTIPKSIADITKPVRRRNTKERDPSIFLITQRHRGKITNKFVILYAFGLDFCTNTSWITYSFSFAAEFGKKKNNSVPLDVFFQQMTRYRMSHIAHNISYNNHFGWSYWISAIESVWGKWIVWKQNLP